MRYGALTVGELIEKLQQLPEHLPVLLHQVPIEGSSIEQEWDEAVPLTDVARAYEDVILR